MLNPAFDNLQTNQALFSMTFFNAGFDANNRPTFTVSPQWWYFPVVTVPLTVFVFVIWLVWKRQREISKGLADAMLKEKEVMIGEE